MNVRPKDQCISRKLQTSVPVVLWQQPAGCVRNSDASHLTTPYPGGGCTAGPSFQVLMHRAHCDDSFAGRISAHCEDRRPSEHVCTAFERPSLLLCLSSLKAGITPVYPFRLVKQMNNTFLCAECVSPFPHLQSICCSHLC